MMAPRGPQSVLWVVQVTTSAMPIGLGKAPTVAMPAAWLMSASSTAPTSSAMARKSSQSGAQVYDVNPPMIILGRLRRARSRISS